MERRGAVAAGGVRSLMDTVAWESTPLGPIEEWSETLLGAVDLMLYSKFPMTLLWGDRFTLIYNDAYVGLIGDKHPALGLPAADVFDEAWEQIGPLLQEVATTGEGLLVENTLVPLERRGFLEDCYFTFSYSAVVSPEGRIEGLLDVVTETTASVLGRRRAEMLALLSESLSVVTSVESIRTAVLDVFRLFDEDFLSVHLRLPELEDVPGAAVIGSPPVDLGGGVAVTDHPDAAGQVIWATIDALADEGSDSVLAARINPRVPVDVELRGSLQLAAAVVGRALGRIRAELAAQARHERDHQFSETIQRALLTHTADIDGAELAVRYVAATTEAQVGGDWYDAFALPQGDLAIVIGDVMGHDRDSAAGMAQMRNLLRGVSMTLAQRPAGVLTALDSSVARLGMTVFATALVAHVDRRDDDTATIRWSTAGHPPPALLHPDGSTEVLTGDPDPLLGVGTFARHDHELTVARGTTVVLYTDGLIERRGRSLETGFAWLTDALAGQQHATPDEICDRLIDQMMPGVDDDVALVVLTV